MHRARGRRAAGLQCGALRASIQVGRCQLARRADAWALQRGQSTVMRGGPHRLRESLGAVHPHLHSRCAGLCGPGPGRPHSSWERLRLARFAKTKTRLRLGTRAEVVACRTQFRLFRKPGWRAGNCRGRRTADREAGAAGRPGRSREGWAVQARCWGPVSAQSAPGARPPAPWAPREARAPAPRGDPGGLSLSRDPVCWLVRPRGSFPVGV